MHNIRITESSLTLFPCTVAPLRWRLHWLHCIRRLPLTAPSSRLLQGNHRMTINHFPATKTEWPHLVLSVSLLLALWALFFNFFFCIFLHCRIPWPCKRKKLSERFIWHYIIIIFIGVVGVWSSDIYFCNCWPLYGGGLGSGFDWNAD